MVETVKNWFNDPTMLKILISAAGLFIVFLAVRIIHLLLSRHVHDADTRYRTRKFTTFIGYVLAIFVLATIFSEKLRGIQIALGVAGAGIAFALQEVVISIAGWFTIAFSRFYKTGDRIKLAGIKGDVIDIGILRTTLMEVGEWIDGDLYNGRVVRVANSFVFKEPVFNYSGDFPFLWDEISIPIRHGSDYRFAQELLRNIALKIVGEYARFAQMAWNELVKKYRIEAAQVQPLVTMTANQDWMTFNLRYVVQYNQRRTTKDRLFMEILDEFEKVPDKVSIASSSMEINLFSEKSSSSPDEPGRS